MELSDAELDFVNGGYSSYVSALQSQLDAYKKELDNPKNSYDERLAIYNKMEKLQEELDKYTNNNQLGGRSR